MNRYRVGSRRYRRSTGTPTVDLLDPALWEEVGDQPEKTTITRPGVTTGPLILSQTGATAASSTGMALIGSSYTDCLVRCEMVVTGWDVATDGDTITGGPAARLSGTVGNTDWYGYWAYIREFSASSRRAGMRRIVNHTPATLASETTGLPSTWSDGTTHILHELQLVGDQITSRAKIVGAGSWARDVTVTDANVATAGQVGIFVHLLEPGMAIEIHSFEVI